MDQPVKAPDGMRAANGKLLLAENGSGIVSALTINGDKATVTVLKDGLKTPTGVEPAGAVELASELVARELERRLRTESLDQV